MSLIKLKKIPAQPLEIAYLKVDQDSKDKNSKNPKKYHLNIAAKFKTGDKNVPDTMNPNTTCPWHYHLESDDKNTWEVYNYGF